MQTRADYLIQQQSHVIMKLEHLKWASAVLALTAVVVFLAEAYFPPDNYEGHLNRVAGVVFFPMLVSGGAVSWHNKDHALQGPEIALHAMTAAVGFASSYAFCSHGWPG